MAKKKATLVINPHAGQNVAHLSDILAIMAAGGWKTHITLKEYGGHSIQLARAACKRGDDLVIAYGGDGTLNQVVNGIMNSGEEQCRLAVIPGGTANLWAREMGIPIEPVRSALSLLCSEERAVDVGYIDVAAVTFADGSAIEFDTEHNGKSKGRKRGRKTKNHFLLMAGLGADAAVMGSVSKTLKYRVGPLAVGLSMMKELPTYPTFPVEVKALRHGEESLLWQGEAVQLVIGNTRRYAIVAEMTPEASIDDGRLDLCIITAGDPLSTAQQLAALVLRRKPDTTVSSYFQEAHFFITIPASVQVQLDGSAVKLKDYLDKNVYEQVLGRAGTEQVMITYRIDVEPHALRVLVPSDCSSELFEQPEAEQSVTEGKELSVHEKDKRSEESQRMRDSESGAVPGSLVRGRRVTMIGKAVQVEIKKQPAYVLAGTTPKLSTSEQRVVAVVINKKTVLHDQQGNTLPFDDVASVKEGAVITVEGKKNKRGVIRATTMVI
jgi:YegS/Rv2252/BmrU family lipid kinase